MRYKVLEPLASWAGLCKPSVYHEEHDVGVDLILTWSFFVGHAINSILSVPGNSMYIYRIRSKVYITALENMTGRAGSIVTLFICVLNKSVSKMMG